MNSYILLKKVTKTIERVSKGVIKRREWRKFGDCEVSHLRISFFVLILFFLNRINLLVPSME